MEVSCSMCKSTWHIDYKEQAFHPNRKTCIQCNIRAFQTRVHKKRAKINTMIEEILKDDPEDKLYNINQIRYYLFLLHKV